MNSYFISHNLPEPNGYELEDCLTGLKTGSNYIEQMGSTLQRENCDDNGDFERDILDCQITQNNAEMIVRGVREYFRTLGKDLQGYGALFSFRKWSGIEKSSQTWVFERALAKNAFIFQDKKEFLLSQCEKYGSLKFLLTELRQKTEEKLFSELLLVIFAVLKAKITSFEGLNPSELEGLPRMMRVWGEEGQQTPMVNSWQLDLEVLDDDVTIMAKRGIEGISAQAVMANNLGLLTLNSGLSESMHQNLSSLFGFISETLFFTLNGTSQSLDNCKLYIAELNEGSGRKRIKIQ